MKKKFLVLLTCLCLAFTSLGIFTACGGDDSSSTDGRNPQIVAVYNAYVVNAQSNGATPLSYEAWLLSIKGEKGDPGEPGQTPTIEISSDGYWVINGVKSNVSAKGEKGDPGEPGQTPTIEISSDGYWVINGEKTEHRAIPEEIHFHKYLPTYTKPTCTEKGKIVHKCECGDEYIYLEFDASGHNFIDGTIEFDEEYHWKKCKNCTVEDMENKEEHSGGTASCTAFAKCSTCNAEYGNKLSHSYTIQMSNETQHWNICSVCSDVDNASKTNHVEDVEYSLDRTNHWKECIICSARVGITAHTGGNATCTEDGICTVCSTAYITRIGHSYTNYVSNNDATCTEDGTKTATCDNNCGETDTIADVGSASHSFDGANPVCSVCNQCDVGAIFAPTNSLYTVELTADGQFKFSAIQKWPEWKFSSTFIEWLNENEYTTLKFKIYFDADNAGTLLNSTVGSWGIHSLVGTDCDTNVWHDVELNVADITTSTQIFQLNKISEADFDVYIKDMQFA